MSVGGQFVRTMTPEQEEVWKERCLNGTLYDYPEGVKYLTRDAKPLPAVHVSRARVVSAVRQRVDTAKRNGVNIESIREDVAALEREKLRQSLPPEVRAYLEDGSIRLPQGGRQ